MIRNRCAAAWLLFAAACGASVPSTSTPAPNAMPSSAPRVEVVFGSAAVEAEVAATPASREVGLMHRRTLGPDAGMLFLLPGPSSGPFWMKDTLVPLSIAFLRRTDGGWRVMRVLDMEPCRRDPCPSYAPGTTYDAAVEVGQGWFARHGVGVGAPAAVRGPLPEAS